MVGEKSGDTSLGWSRGILLIAGVFMGALAAPTSAQETIRVGERTVEFIRAGSGDPVVVIEAGAGEGWRGWEPMVRRLSSETTVIAYARPGYDGSSATEGVRRPERSAEELLELLNALEVTSQVVLVGHSLGGLIIHAFAGLHPDRVAGLVYVDPSHPRMGAALSQLDDGFWANFRARAEGLEAQGPAWLAAEMRGLEEILEEGALRAPPPEDIPTAVLTSMQTREGGPTVLTPEGRRVWRALHVGYAHLATLSLHVVTRDAGHYLHLEAPDLTAEAIMRILRWVRGGD